MPQDQSSQESYQSSLPELHIPEGGFKSSIPGHLLEDTDPQMKWLLEEVSKNTQATEFACKAAVESNKHLRALNGKTFKNEKSAEEIKESVEILKSQATAISPFIKPISMFAALWEYRAFRWFFYAGVIFFLGIVYPYYLQHTFSQWLDSVAKFFVGAP